MFNRMYTSTLVVLSVIAVMGAAAGLNPALAQTQTEFSRLQVLNDKGVHISPSTNLQTAFPEPYGHEF